jgi:hypothetical protein
MGEEIHRQRVHGSGRRNRENMAAKFQGREGMGVMTQIGIGTYVSKVSDKEKKELINQYGKERFESMAKKTNSMLQKIAELKRQYSK